jgi:hypothetical protein
MFDRARNPLAAALIVAAGLAAGGALAADKDHGWSLNVENATAKVGEPTAIHATLETVDGNKVSRGYRNRLIELSAFDDAVEFDKPVVVGTVAEDNTSVAFDVGVTPTKPGKHVINGVFRFGFHNAGRINMISIPLIATVEGTE